MVDLAARLASPATTPTVPLITAVMSNRTSRVLNGITRFTSVMSATTNTYHTIVRTAAPAESTNPRALDPDLLEAGRIILDGMLAMGA